MSKPIVVKNSDGKTFEIDEAVASQSQIIKYMIEDGCADTVIPLPNVTSKVLSKVIEYCKKYVDESDQTKKDNNHDAEGADLKTFDAEFMLSLLEDDVNRFYIESVFYVDVLKAAKYLEIPDLVDLCWNQALNSEIVKNQIRDISPEEEAKIRRENPWAF